MHMVIGTKQLTWLHAITAKPWVFTFLYASLLTYLVFLTPGRSNLDKEPHNIHIIPFSNSLQAVERLNDSHAPVTVALFLCANLLGNILLFIPLPPLLYYTFNIRGPWALMASGISLSVGIETVQYCFGIGIPDIDDLICNTTGCLAGMCLQNLFIRHLKTFRSKNT